MEKETAMIAFPITLTAAMNVIHWKKANQLELYESKVLSLDLKYENHSYNDTRVNRK